MSNSVSSPASAPNHDFLKEALAILDSALAPLASIEGEKAKLVYNLVHAAIIFGESMMGEL